MPCLGLLGLFTPLGVGPAWLPGCCLHSKCYLGPTRLLPNQGMATETERNVLLLVSDALTSVFSFYLIKCKSLKVGVASEASRPPSSEPGLGPSSACTTSRNRAVPEVTGILVQIPVHPLTSDMTLGLTSHSPRRDGASSYPTGKREVMCQCRVQHPILIGCHSYCWLIPHILELVSLTI